MTDLLPCPTDAIENLTNFQEQADMHGEFVKVSRQALDEVLAYVTRTPPATQADDALVESWLLKCTDGRVHADTIAILKSFARWAACREAAAHAAGRDENYKMFTDGMEAAAQICGSLAETTYDDADAFEAATGCEVAIMRVVQEQRKEQAAIERGQDGSKGDE